MRAMIRQEQALYMLQSKEATGIGFIEARFDSEQNRYPMEYGWFDLRDDDINLVIKENHLSLELWFNGMDEPHLSVRTVVVEDGDIRRTIEQVKLKLKISLEHLDYVVVNGTRYVIER